MNPIGAVIIDKMNLGVAEDLINFPGDSYFHFGSHSVQKLFWQEVNVKREKF